MIMFGFRARLVVMAAAGGLALTSCSSTGTSAGGGVSHTNGTTTSAQKAAPAPSSTPGLAAKNATGDVKFGAIRVDAKLGKPSIQVTITNHSSKRSNYIVDM